VEVHGGRATGVRVAGGERLGARRAVLAAVPATVLYEDLLGRSLEHFQADPPTVKVDWSLDGPIPWTAAGARRAGTVHVAAGMHGLSVSSSQVARGERPERPFLVVGQYSMVDPTRCPPGKEVAWAYTHVPSPATFSDGDLDDFVRRMEDEVERLAPGFRALVRMRQIAVLGPGAVNQGTAQLHQQLVFRPVPWHLGRPETPVAGLYLASAAAHPGGGVHGGPGSNAARAALARDRLTRPFRR
jgi:phytoene dehydrogenase-like protein